MRMRFVETALFASLASSGVLVALTLWGCDRESSTPLVSASSPGLVSMDTGSESCILGSECTGENLGRCCQPDIFCDYKICSGDGQICRDNVCHARCNADADCTLADSGDNYVCRSKLCILMGCRNGVPAASASPPTPAVPAIPATPTTPEIAGIPAKPFIPAMLAIPEIPCAPGQQCIGGLCYCTSNRACDAGHVCHGKGEAATCVPTTCESGKKNDTGLCDLDMEDEPSSGCSASGTGGSAGFLVIAVSALTVAGVRARRRRSE